MLVSTLVVRTGSSGGGSLSVSPGPPPVGLPVPTHKVLVERVTLRYRISSLPGTLDASFSGESDPFCAALDSCAATGSIALSLPEYRNTLFVSASRIVTQRVDAGRALADFRRGLLHGGGGGLGPPADNSTARVVEMFAGPGGSRCQDSVDSRRPTLFGAAGLRSRSGIALALDSSLGPDLLRTHCPGPSFVDVFGNSRAVVRGSIGADRLLAHHSVISMTSAGSFAGLGYAGSRSGALRFSLTLERARAGTVEEERP